MTSRTDAGDGTNDFVELTVEIKCANCQRHLRSETRYSIAPKL